jgi:Flp pilus assembly protein TadB
VTEQALPPEQSAPPEQFGSTEPGTPAGGRERRRRGERRSVPRRAEDRERQWRSLAATFLAFCGALAILYLFFAAVGAVDLGEALVFTIAAAVLAILWLLGAWQRSRTGAAIVTRPDRERRGF